MENAGLIIIWFVYNKLSDNKCNEEWCSKREREREKM